MALIVDLGQFWHDNRYQAYEGLTISGYPNFYIMLGPYALIGISYFKMAEGNAIHLSRCIREARRRKATRVEGRQPVHDRYFQHIQQRQQNTVFLNHNFALSNSYYFDHHGERVHASPLDLGGDAVAGKAPVNGQLPFPEEYGYGRGCRESYASIYKFGKITNLG